MATYIAIPLKAKLGQISSDSVRIQDPSKRFYSLVPKPHQRWRPVIDLSRLDTFLHVEKFKMETPESIRTSLVPGEWVSSIDLSDAYLHIPINPKSRKYLRFCHRSQVFQFTSLPFGLATAPQVFTMIVKEVKLMALSSGLRLHQYLDDWLIRSQCQEEAQVNTQAVVDLTQSLGWIINQEISELKPTQVFTFVGYKYHLDSALVRPTQERWLKLQDLILRLQDLILRLQDLILRLKSKHVFSSHEALSFSSQGALEISSVAGQPPLYRCHFCTLRLVAESCKHDERRRPSSQRPQYPTLYRRLKRRLGRSLESKIYQGSVVRPGKKATHKRPRVEGGLTGSLKFQGPVPGPNSSRCNGQLDSGSLHKQTRRNSLSRDVLSLVEDYDLVPPLSHNFKGQTHSRVSECDGRPIQVQPSAVNRMVTASTGVQIDLPQVVHTSCRLICHSSEPQTPSLRVSNPRPKGLGHRCSEHKLDGSHCLCLPSNGSPSQGDPKIRQCHCLIIIIAPGWPGMPWFWDLVQLSTEIPLQLPVSTTLLKQSHKYVFHNNPQQFNLHAWCLGENSVDFSTPSVTQISDFFMYQDLNRRPSTIGGYRTAIVYTLDPTAHHIAHNADLHRLLSSFHRDRPKSSRNLPKWNLSVVLNELTKAPFEPMKDTYLKHLTLKTAFLLALASAKRRSEIHA